MNYVIVNYDITHYLVYHTFWKETIYLLMVNSYCYEAVTSTRFYQQLNLLKNCERNKLIMCYIKGYLLLLEKLYLSNLTYTHHWASSYAIENNQLPTLCWMASKNIPIICHRFSILQMVRSNSILLFQWLADYYSKKQKLAAYSRNDNAHLFYYSESIIEWAAEEGQVKVLDWALNNVPTFTYSEQALDRAASNGHVSVFHWFQTHNLALKYTKDAMNGAVANNHWPVIHWFADNRLPIYYSEFAIIAAASNNQPSILDWFKSRGLPILGRDYALKIAISKGHSNVVNWFLENKG